MQILTHRWLEPLNNNFNFKESSKEAFENHLQRWFWLEFDISLSKDWKLFIFHDSNFSRITNNKLLTEFKDLEFHKIKNIANKYWYNLMTFEELIKLILKYRKKWEYSTLHLKYKFHNKLVINQIIKFFKKYKLYDYIFIFDIKLYIAKYIKSIDNKIKLFPSVAHNYDIERFNRCVWWTLLSIDEVKKYKEYFDWVWMDEWDRKDKNKKTKKFYTEENVKIFKDLWLKIWLVTPELHAKSPWLLGNEFHDDCKNIKLLRERFEEIKKLNIDYVCSDYIQYLLN